MILDTCFFIDVERGNPATQTFLASNSSEELCVTVISGGELASGFDSTQIQQLWERLRHFRILGATIEAAACYGVAYRRLKDSGQMIGANDLWIASIALANQMPVVTRNTSEFTRVSGLRVVGY